MALSATIPPPWPRGLERALGTFALLASVLRLRLFGTRDQRRAATLLRLRIERLGGVWIKLGQALALRRDLLPPAYCDQFMRLFDRVPPFPAKEARTIIEHELGQPLADLFDRFEDAPIASASIGQVHRAWRRGEMLAVKVRRPGVRHVFAADFRMLRCCATFADLLGFGAGLSLTGLLAEFETMTLRELDYREEAFSARLLARNAAGSGMERHVGSVPSLSSSRVLTAECALGVPLQSLLERPDASDAAGLERIAEHLLWNTLNQIYQFGVFHADPHPANLFVDDQGGITYVDHGQVGQIGDDTRKRLLRFAWSIAEERFDEACAQFLEIARPTERTDLAAVRQETRIAMARHIRAMRGAPIDKAAACPFDRLMMDIARRHRLAVTPELALYLKTISMVDAVMRILAPALDGFGVQSRFFARAAVREAFDSLRPAHLLSSMNRFALAIEETLALVARLDDTAESADAVVRGVRRRLAGLNLVLLLGVAGTGALSLLALGRQTSLLGVPIAGWVLGCVVASVLACFALFSQAFQLRRADRRGALRRQRRSGTIRRLD